LVIGPGELNLQDWKMTDEVARWKLTDWKITDWKMTDRLTMAYKAGGGKCEFWAQICVHITTTYNHFGSF